VRKRLLALTVLGSCGGAPVDRAPVAAPCAFNRVGYVTVSGAPRSAVPQLAVLEGTLDDPERTQRIAAVATRALAAQGYARASLAITRHPACRVDLEIAVTLGPRFQIAAITFETDDAFPAAERLAVVEDALGTVNTVGGVYIEYRLTRALAELARRYHDAGWLEARLGPPRATYDPHGTVALAIPVSAGRRFRLGSIKASGAGPGARQAVLQTLGLRAGEYYDGVRVRRAIERARHRVARWVELRASVAEGRPEVDVEAIMDSRR